MLEGLSRENVELGMPYKFLANEWKTAKGWKLEFARRVLDDLLKRKIKESQARKRKRR